MPDRRTRRLGGVAVWMLIVVAGVGIGDAASASTPPVTPPATPSPTTTGPSPTVVQPPPTVVAPPTAAPPSVATNTPAERPLVGVDVVACDDGTGSGVVHVTVTNPADGGPSRSYRVTTRLYYRDVQLADSGSTTVVDGDYGEGSYVTQVSDLANGVRVTTNFEVPTCPPATPPTPTATTSPVTAPPSTVAASAAPGSTAEGASSVAPTLAVDPFDSTVTVQAFADPDTPVGSSTIRRNADGVLATFESAGNVAGHALTLWWVVFNRPANCSAPACDLDDIYIGGDPSAGLDPDAIADADVVSGYAAGTVVNRDGTASMASRLALGAPGVEIAFGTGPVLKVAGAEVHLVARSHGPVVQAVAVDQLTSYRGGCTNLLVPPARATSPGDCVDDQFAAHAPT